jgi:hypothetical protein
MNSLTYETLANLCDRKLGTRDVACPLCGPDRRSSVNRKRQVLRIWHDELGFATYSCARCGAKGWARADGVQSKTRSSTWPLKPTNDNQRDDDTNRQLGKARWMWGKGEPPHGSPVEPYLGDARNYSGPLPQTIRYLKPFKPQHHPAMIAVFAIPDEIEPGVLKVRDDQIRGIHLTLLKPDGSSKAGTERDKLMIGSSSGTPIVLAPMTDSLGLVVTEGIEDGLSLHEATGLGVWAAGSASRLPSLADTVPAYTDCVTVAADDDEAGRTGAVKLAQALQARGIHVQVSLPATRRAAA